MIENGEEEQGRFLMVKKEDERKKRKMRKQTKMKMTTMMEKKQWGAAPNSKEERHWRKMKKGLKMTTKNRLKVAIEQTQGEQTLASSQQGLRQNNLTERTRGYAVGCLVGKRIDSVFAKKK